MSITWQYTCGFTSTHVSKQENTETIDRMEAMEIDDDFSGSRNLTVKGLINRGTVSTWTEYYDQ